MSEDSEALIREIEEEVRREKMTKLWDRYGVLFLGTVGLAVVLVGGWQWYTAYQKDQAQRAGSQFQEAVTLLEGKKSKDGLAILEQIAQKGTPVYATLAKMRLAAAKRENGDAKGATELYEAVSKDSSADATLRSFANLQIASLKVDDGTWTDAQNRLNALANDSGPWRHSARELLGLAAYKHKKWAEARDAYTTLLGDQSTPQDIRQRAQIALALVTREAPDTKPKQASPAGSVKTDLKKDKSSGDGAKSKAGAGGDTNSTTAPSKGAGAKNDAEKK